MRDVYRNTHACKVKAIAESDKRQGHHMVQDKFLEIFPRFFQNEHNHNRLLCPITRLEQIICLENALVRSMRESFEHGSGVEVPERASGHNIESKRSEYGEVECGIHLLHEPPLFGPFGDPTSYGSGADDSLHDKLPRETQDHGVKCDEGHVCLTFAIHVRSSWIVGTQRVGEEDGFVKRILFSGVHKVATEDDKNDDKGIDPGMLLRNVLPFPQC